MHSLALHSYVSPICSTLNTVSSYHWGPWWGPQCRLSILRNGNAPCRYFLIVLVDFKIVQCRLSILRNGNVPCHYLWNIPVDCKVAQCCLSILRRCCVALSNLRVKSPSTRHTGRDNETIGTDFLITLFACKIQTYMEYSYFHKRVRCALRAWRLPKNPQICYTIAHYTKLFKTRIEMTNASRFELWLNQSMLPTQLHVVYLDVTVQQRSLHTKSGSSITLAVLQLHHTPLKPHNSSMSDILDLMYFCCGVR